MNTWYFPYPCDKTALGFTLIETLVTVAVLSILVALAAPSFRAIQQRWDVHSAVQALESSLTFARSEAIRRAGKVALRQATTCPAGGWSCGWTVFVDQDGDGVQASTEQVLQTIELPGTVQIVHGSNAAALRLDRYGVLVGAHNVSFAFAPTHDTAAPHAQRMLCLSQGWRMRTLGGSSCT